MNRNYRVVFNQSTGTYVAVAENNEEYDEESIQASSEEGDNE